MKTLMRRNQNKSHNSLQRTILAITLLFAVCIGSILAVLSALFYSKYSRQTVIEQTSSNLSYMVDGINTNLSSLDNFIYFCQSNKTVTAFVSSSYSASVTLEALDRLNEEYLSYSIHDYIHRLIIGNYTDKYLQLVGASYSTSRNVSLMTTELDYFEEQLSSKKADFTHGFEQDPYQSSISVPVLNLIRPISTKSASVVDGYVVISLNTEFFTSAMKYYSINADSALYLSLGEHIYRMEEDGLTEVDPEEVSFTDNTDFTLSDDGVVYSYTNTVTGQEGLCVTKALNAEGCYISQLVSTTELSSYYSFYYLIPIVIILGIAVITLLLSALLYHIISVPVARIQQCLKQISAGDFARDPDIEWNHELGDIGRGINDLSESIDTLIETKLQDEKAKNALEYQVLQNQINPHFLYNTLNSIKWMAVTQGADGIAEVTTALSRLLRNISKGASSIIPIREELSLLQDYFLIQQYRYGSAVTMEVTVDDESLYDCGIVKFTLQPIVENAIFHGIEPKGTAGNITLHIFEQPAGEICLVVEDDGVGMPPDQVKTILEEETTGASSAFFKNIGFPNIHQRLQYEYGRRFGLKVESELGQYTRVTVRIPKKICE